MIYASAITPAAQHWLRTTTSARLLSVHERACNLLNQNNELLALIASSRGLNPFALVVDAPFNAISMTDRVEMRDGELEIGDWRIEVARAALWNPAPDWEMIRTAQMDWAALLPLALERAPEWSLLDLYLPVERASSIDECHTEARRAEASRPNAQPLRFAQGDNVRAHAHLGAELLIEGLFSKSLILCLDGIHSLAGLGGGLTPAGDDFIVGALLAVWAGLYGEAALPLCAPIAEAAAERTTFLSAAYLRAAARGECMLQWHKLFKAALQDEAARTAIGELVNVGHTSGADALAGFLAASCLRERAVSLAAL